MEKNNEQFWNDIESLLEKYNAYIPETSPSGRIGRRRPHPRNYDSPRQAGTQVPCHETPIRSRLNDEGSILLSDEQFYELFTLIPFSFLRSPYPDDQDFLDSLELDRRIRNTKRRVGDYNSSIEDRIEKFRVIEVSQKKKTSQRAFGYHTNSCTCCGEEFQSIRSGALYCSARCGDLARRERERKRAREEITHTSSNQNDHTCEICGRFFSSFGSAKYCSSKCKQKAYRLRKKQDGMVVG